MRRLATLLSSATLLALTVLASGEDDAAAPKDPVPVARPTIHAATWAEAVGDEETLVVALYREAREERRHAPPIEVAIGIALDGERDAPDYGRIGTDHWRSVHVAAGEVVLARVALRGRGGASVLLADRAATADVDVHELVHGEMPPGAFFFERPFGGGPVRLDAHVVDIGGSVAMTIDAPTDDGFFRDETFEILRVARRLPLGSNDPDGPGGCVAVTWTPGSDDGVTLLEAEAGEAKIRAHFEKPDCAWATRHVGWMKDFWIHAYDRPTAITYALDTTGVKTPGRVTEHWHGYGALCTESIWPNGFGGSSANLTLPALLVVRPGATRRTVTLTR